MTARRVEDPDEIAVLFRRDPHAHLYGLADLEPPFWARSSWFRDGDAVVGVIGLGDGFTTGYAMSRESPQPTLELLTIVESHLPPGSTVVGALGLSSKLSETRGHESLGVHHRMILGNFRPVDHQGAVPIGPEHLSALQDLHAQTAGQGFFLPAMLNGMPFVGIWEGDRLVASAGCHVTSLDHGVAAVGAVVTAPDRRGRGYGSAVTSALCSQLVGSYETIGLNVSSRNATAIRIYERLGLERVLDYEEVVLG